MAKVLFVATTTIHLRTFHLPYIQWFKDRGYEVHIAAKKNCDDITIADKIWDLPMERSPYSFNNYKAYKLLKNILKEQHYSLLTCHTAMGGVIARLAARKERSGGLKLLYTAHGFHFFKGGPLKNWLIYFPIEKVLSRYTDALITINQEDYDIALKYGFKNKRTFKIPGIGVNPDKFFPVSQQDKSDLRKQLGFEDNLFLILYTAEFISRKNHKFLIESAQPLLNSESDIRILFAGRGQDMSMIQHYVSQIKLQDKVIFLGFQSEIDKYVKISDLIVSTSRQEGLGLNLIEGLFCGKPIIATLDRGHKEIVENSKNGFLISQNNKEEFLFALKEIYTNKDKLNFMGKYGLESSRKFRLENSLVAMSAIYNEFL